MSIPKEPRQQMINLMYLVLTALLALNVSAEVLNAFQLVSNGMKNSTSAIEDKNAQMMAAFQKQAQRDPAKAKDLYASAVAAETAVNNFVVYLDTLREEVVQLSGGWVEDDEGNKTDDLADKKNYDGPTTIMINRGKGDSLNAKIDELRTLLLNLPGLTPEDKAALETQITLTAEFDTAAAKKIDKKDWAGYHFDHVPVVAVNTLFNKFKGDARTSAGVVMETLYKKIGEMKYDFDALAAQVFAPSNYIMSGQPYKAEIFVTAYSSSTDPVVLIGEFKPGVKVRDESGAFLKLDQNPLKDGFTTVEEVTNGRAIFKETASGVGERKKYGVVKVRKPGSDDFEFYPFELMYQSAQAGVVVSPDKMNVFYIGVDNPVSVSVPGFSPDKVSASLTKGGSISKASGDSKYTVKVTTVGETEVVVSATLPSGDKKTMGSVPFRIKRVPDPVAKVGNLGGGKVPAAQFKVQRGVLAVLENFDFDIKFSVVSFEMTYSAKRQDLIVKSATGPAFSSDMLELLNRSKPGDVFYLDEIKVKGPDGTTRKLPSIAFTLI